MNILTTLFKGGVKFSNNDYLNRLIALLAIGASLYLIVATVSSLLIAGIIYLSGKRKAIMLASNN